MKHSKLCVRPFSAIMDRSACGGTSPAFVTTCLANLLFVAPDKIIARRICGNAPAFNIASSYIRAQLRHRTHNRLLDARWQGHLGFSNYVVGLDGREPRGPRSTTRKLFIPSCLWRAPSRPLADLVTPYFDVCGSRLLARIAIGFQPRALVGVWRPRVTTAMHEQSARLLPSLAFDNHLLDTLVAANHGKTFAVLGARRLCPSSAVAYRRTGAPSRIYV